MWNSSETALLQQKSYDQTSFKRIVFACYFFVVSLRWMSPSYIIFFCFLNYDKQCERRIKEIKYKRKSYSLQFLRFLNCVSAIKTKLTCVISSFLLYIGAGAANEKQICQNFLLPTFEKEFFFEKGNLADRRMCFPQQSAQQCVLHIYRVIPRTVIKQTVFKNCYCFFKLKSQFRKHRIV